MIRESKIENIEVRIAENRMDMGDDAAAMVGEKLRQLLTTQDFVNIIFAAAPSQNEFLAALLEENGINWKRINAFHMDEYIGLDEEAPQRFAHFLKKRIFDHLPFRTINYLNGGAPDAIAECKRYAALLHQFPTDVVCMGIGENGHIAFNDPPVANFKDSEMVKVVELDAACRRQQVNDGCFTDLSYVPAYALTLTIPALMAGRYLYCMVPGSRKAEAVYNTLSKEVIEQYPSTILKTHSNAVLFLDSQSSVLL